MPGNPIKLSETYEDVFTSPPGLGEKQHGSSAARPARQNGSGNRGPMARGGDRMNASLPSPSPAARLRICDVGLRDGLQNEKTPVSTADKLRLGAR
jgi:hypothetical protein